MAIKKWVFYDTVSKTQTNSISTSDAQAAILKMKPQIIDQLFIWTEGWNSWQQLRTYLESDQKYFISTFTVPVPKTKEDPDATTLLIKEVLDNTKTQTSYKIQKEEEPSFSSIRLDEETISRILNQEVGIHDFNGDEVTLSNIQKPNLDFSKFTKKSMDRRETRHEFKIEVLLISKKSKAFRSHSKNISLSGVLLEDTIPFDYYDTDFDVVIINKLTTNPIKSRVSLTAKVVSSSGGLAQRLQFHNPTELQKQALRSLLEDYINQKKNDKAG